MSDHYFTPHVGVTVTNGVVTGCYIDWADSWTSSWDDTGDEIIQWSDDAEIASLWIDKMANLGLLPSGDFKGFTPEQVQAALQFLTTLTNTPDPDS